MYWLSGRSLKGLSGASGMRKLSRMLGKTPGRSALPGSTWTSGTSWVSKASPCHCRCKRKSLDLKTFSFVLVSSTSRQGTFSPNSGLTAFVPWLLHELYPISLWSHFTPLELLPCQTAFYQIKHAVPDSSDLFSAICFPSTISSSSLPLHSCKVKPIHLDLKKPDTQSVTPVFVCICWNILPDTSRNSICLSVPDTSVSLQSLRPQSLIICSSSSPILYLRLSQILRFVTCHLKLLVFHLI